MFIVDKTGKIAFAKIYPLDQAPNNEELLAALEKDRAKVVVNFDLGGINTRSISQNRPQRQQTKGRNQPEGCRAVNAPNTENVPLDVRKVERNASAASDTGKKAPYQRLSATNPRSR